MKGGCGRRQGGRGTEHLEARGSEGEAAEPLVGSSVTGASLILDSTDLDFSNLVCKAPWSHRMFIHIVSAEVGPMDMAAVVPAPIQVSL